MIHIDLIVFVAFLLKFVFLFYFSCLSCRSPCRRFNSYLFLRFHSCGLFPHVPVQHTKDGNISVDPLPIDDLYIADFRLWATVRVDPSSPLLLAHCPYPLKANVPWTFLPSQSQLGAATGVAALLHMPHRELPPFSYETNCALAGSWSKAQAQKSATGIGRFLEQLSHTPEKFVVVSKNLRDQLPKRLDQDIYPSLVSFDLTCLFLQSSFSLPMWDGFDFV
jgi:hypothetical protein